MITIISPTVSSTGNLVFDSIRGAYLNCTYYVDSVNGNDRNDGQSPISAFKTIAHLLSQTFVAGNSIGLACNSVWREELDIPADNMTILSYGYGAKPLLDCSNAISTGDWSKTAGFTNLYQATETIAVDPNKAMVFVWENGIRLVRATSQANCDSTAGSYFPSTDSSSPTTLYVHASDDSNPGTNGKLYEYSARFYGLYSNGFSGLTIRGIWCRRNLHNDGSLKPGLNATLYDCLASEGQKHNIYVSEGSVLNNVEARDAYSPNVVGAMIVYNADTANGQNVTFINCKVTDAPNLATNGTVGGFYGHTNVSGAFGIVTYVNCIANNLGLNYGIGGSGDEASTVVIGGNFSSLAIGIVPGSPNVNMSNVVISASLRAIDISNVPANTIASVAGATMTLTGGAGNAGIYTTKSGIVMKLTNSSIIGTSAIGIYGNGGTGLMLTSTGNTINVPGGAYYDLAFGYGSLNSDFNAFKGISANTVSMIVNSDNYTFSQYQTATGQDSHSSHP